MRNKTKPRDIFIEEQFSIRSDIFISTFFERKRKLLTSVKAMVIPFIILMRENPTTHLVGQNY